MFWDFWKGCKGKKEYVFFVWNDLMLFIRNIWFYFKNSWKWKWKEDQYV